MAMLPKPLRLTKKDVKDASTLDAPNKELERGTAGIRRLRS